MVIENASIRTMAADSPRATHMLVVDGRIRAIGGEEVGWAAEQHSPCERIDARGRIVIPGFVDAHTHIELASLGRQKWVGVRGLSLEAMLRKMSETAREREVGTWLVFQGTFDDEVPTQTQLDEVSQSHPILLRTSMHHVIANSLAMRLAGIDGDHAVATRGLRVLRDARGVPTGELLEGFDLFPIPSDSLEETADRLEQEIQHSFVRNGVTTIGEIPFSETGTRAYGHLYRSGRLPVRIGIAPTLKPGLHPLVGDIRDWTRTGVSSGQGDDRLWIAAIKIFMDGAGPAAYRWSQLEGEGRHDPLTWGITTRDMVELTDTLVTAYKAGMQPWIHAIGDAAQDMVISAIEQAMAIADVQPDHRTRIEHFGNEYTDDAAFERIQRLGVIPVLTAAFLHFDRGAGEYRLKSVRERGLLTPGNSDNAGTQPFATNPWFGIEKMITRRNRHGQAIHPEESITIDEAIRSYTWESAFALRKEDRIGSLEPAKYADFLILGITDFADVGEAIADIPVDAVYVEGDRIA